MVLMGGSGTDLVVEVDLEAGVDQRLLHVDAHAAVADALVGDHEDLAAVELLGLDAQLVDGADAGDERLGLAVDAHLALDAAQLGRGARGRREDARFGFVVDVLHGSQLSLVSGWRGRRPTPYTSAASSLIWSRNAGSAIPMSASARSRSPRPRRCATPCSVTM